MRVAPGHLAEALVHLRIAREDLPYGKPYGQDHYRQLLLHEAMDKIRCVLKLLEAKKEETCEKP